MNMETDEEEEEYSGESELAEDEDETDEEEEYSDEYELPNDEEEPWESKIEENLTIQQMLSILDKPAFCATFLIIIIAISLQFLFSYSLFHVFYILLNSVDPSHPKVVFHVPEDRNWLSCELISSIRTDKSTNIYKFTLEYVVNRPWASLEGNWTGYSHRFRLYTYLANGMGDVRDDIKDWDRPGTLKRNLVKNFSVKQKEKITYNPQLSVVLEIETDAPLSEKSVIVQYDYNSACNFQEFFTVEQKK